MSRVLAQGVYVTGTDTGIGKTLVSTALLHGLRKHGLRALGMKPVASGCEWVDGQWRNDDALALQAASSEPPAYALVNPFALEHATSPQLAAGDAGIAISIEPITAAYARLREQADVVVVEGVGGWAASLDAALDQRDVAAALGLPVLLVVGLRLGCQSHARLTARAVQADGFTLAGWVGNRVDPQFDRADDYMAMLRGQLPAPCLGVMPHAPGDDASAYLQIEPLLPHLGAGDTQRR